MNNYKTIKEIAELYSVTPMGVRYWIKKYDIPYKIEKVIRIKPRMVLLLEDVEAALGVTLKDEP